MILDALAEIPVNAVAGTDTLDLDAIRPGPGEAIVCWARGVGGDLIINHAATSVAGSQLMVVDATEDVEFRLPSNALQFVQGVAAAGEIHVTLEGNQTNT